MTTPGETRALIAANIRAERARAGIRGVDVVARMRELGYTTWHPQTIGQVERGSRRVLMEELLGLAIALECPMMRFFYGLA